MTEYSNSCLLSKIVEFDIIYKVAVVHVNFDQNIKKGIFLEKMAKSLRSKRMRRNRALQAEKKAPRVLKRLKENLEQAKKFNVSLRVPRKYKQTRVP